MTSDLAKTIAAACLEAIQSRPDTPEVEELAEVVEPFLPNRAESEYGMIATLRTQNNRLRFEKKELREEISRLSPANPADNARRGWHRGQQCNRYGCQGVMGLFVTGTSSGNQCSHCGYVVPGPPNMITEGSDV